MSEDLIKAIKTNDLVKLQRQFNEAVEVEKEKLIEARRVELAKNIFVEGEKPEDKNDDDTDDEDDDDEEDEDD